MPCSRTTRWLVVVLVVLLTQAGALVLAPVASEPASAAVTTPDLLLRVPCLAGDPFNPDTITGSFDAGSISCTGHPKNC